MCHLRSDIWSKAWQHKDRTHHIQCVAVLPTCELCPLCAVHEGRHPQVTVLYHTNSQVSSGFILQEIKIRVTSLLHAEVRDGWQKGARNDTANEGIATQNESFIDRQSLL